MRDFAYGEYRQVIAMKSENWSHGFEVIAMKNKLCLLLGVKKISKG